MENLATKQCPKELFLTICEERNKQKIPDE
jgi:hypothetical protein